jgi:hypothetical protein
MVSGFCRLPVVIRSADAGASGRAAFPHPGYALGKRHVFGEIGQCTPYGTTISEACVMRTRPTKSLIEFRAAYMPDAARSVSGHPPS